jgi:hypothetical protein
MNQERLNRQEETDLYFKFIKEYGTEGATQATGVISEAKKRGQPIGLATWQRATAGLGPSYSEDAEGRRRQAEKDRRELHEYNVVTSITNMEEALRRNATLTVDERRGLHASEALGIRNISPTGAQEWIDDAMRRYNNDTANMPKEEVEGAFFNSLASVGKVPVMTEQGLSSITFDEMIRVGMEAKDPTLTAGQRRAAQKRIVDWGIIEDHDYNEVSLRTALFGPGDVGGLLAQGEVGDLRYGGMRFLANKIFGYTEENMPEGFARQQIAVWKPNTNGRLGNAANRMLVAINQAHLDGVNLRSGTQATREERIQAEMRKRQNEIAQRRRRIMEGGLTQSGPEN